MCTVLQCVYSFFKLENENLRQDFASKANTAGAYIDAKNSALSDLNLQSQGTLEEQLASLKSFHEEVQSFQSNIDACESANQQMQAAMVFDNPHTRYTIEVSMDEQIFLNALLRYYGAMGILYVAPCFKCTVVVWLEFPSFFLL